MNIQEFYGKRSRHYLGCAIGATASIFCLLGLSNDGGKALGYGGLMLSLGYGLATATANQKITEWQPKFEETIVNEQTEIWNKKLIKTEEYWSNKSIKLENELQALKNALEQAKTSIQGYIGVTERNELLQAQLSDITRKLEEFQNTFESRLDLELEAIYQRDHLPRVKEINSKHRARERYLLAEITGLEEKYKNSLSTLVEQYQELITGYESVIEAFHPELETIKADFTARLQAATQERDRVYSILAQYQKPRLFEGNSYGATVGNAVISFYLEQDLIADPVKYESRGNGFVDVWLRPRTGTVDAYEKLARELFIKQAYLALPKYKIEDGSIRISLRCDVSEGKRRSQEIEQPDSDWFESVVTEVQHIRVTGERDSGKSTLVSNLVNLKLLQNPGCKIKLCNPLYGSLKDNWDIPASWKSFDEAIDGLAELATLILERNRIGREAKDEGLPTPKFEPILYIFDEIDMTVSTHERAGTEFLKTCLKMGTHYNVHVIYIGQSPLCSTLGLKKPDLNHSAAFHLGKNIGRAIDDLQASTSGTKDMLRNQYELMIEQGNNFIVFCEHDKKQFLALPPSPNCYQLSAPQAQTDAPREDIRNQLERLLDKESTENTPSATPPEAPQNTAKIDEGSGVHNAPKCPVCESLNIQKRGKRGEKQRYQCKDCGKHFSK